MRPVIHQGRCREPMGDYERDLARRMRGLRASWDDVAKAIGRPTLDVRRAFDPEFVDPGRMAPRLPRPKAKPSNADVAAEPGAPSATVTVLGRKVQVGAMSKAALAMLEALASGEEVSTEALYERVRLACGRDFAPDHLRGVLVQVRKAIPAGYVVRCIRGFGHQLVRFRPAEALDCSTLSRAQLAMLLALSGGSLVTYAELLERLSVLEGRPVQRGSLATHTHRLALRLPADVELKNVPLTGYQLTGDGLPELAEAARAAAAEFLPEAA